MRRAKRGQSAKRPVWWAAGWLRGACAVAAWGAGWLGGAQPAAAQAPAEAAAQELLDDAEDTAGIGAGGAEAGAGAGAEGADAAQRGAGGAEAAGGIGAVDYRGEVAPGYARDALLDGPLDLSRASAALARPADGFAGASVGVGLTLYGGGVRSLLLPEESTLQRALRPAVSLELAYRMALPLEWALDFALGFGRTWSVPQDAWVHARDLLFQLKGRWYFYEQPALGLYGGVGGLAALFDVHEGTIKEAGFGPSGLLGAQWRADRHVLLSLEVVYAPIFNPLAYRFRDMTEKEREENPGYGRVRIAGEWSQTVLIQLGLRLVNL